MGPRFPLPGGQSQSGGGCSTTEEEASVRDLRTKGPQEQRSLQSLLAALGPVRSPDLSSLLDPTSGMSAVWSGQRKGALGRQGKPLYQKLRTRVAWLAQRTDVSAVANYFRVTWRVEEFVAIRSAFRPLTRTRRPALLMMRKRMVRMVCSRWVHVRFREMPFVSAMVSS